MVAGPKRRPRYDPKAAGHKRNLIIQISLTAFVVVFAVALVLYIVSGDKKATFGEATTAVRVASSSVVTKDGSIEPKAVLSLYEDFQCPHCRDFEQAYGPTIGKMIDSGAVAVDYYMVAILNSPANQNYSTRAASAAYCVGDSDRTPTKDVFRRYHTALFAQQSPEGSPAPDNAGLVETARQSGVAPADINDCVNSGKYADMVNGLAAAAKINATPTVRINGEDYQFSTPDALVAKIKEIVGK
jgi:protein-disulfide isomerase